MTLLIILLLQISGTIDGHVIDGKTGEPAARAQVVLSESHRSTTTDENGRFEFRDVGGESITIYVNAAGYALARKIVTGASPSGDLEIVLVPEGAAAREEITVATKPFEVVETSVSSEERMTKSEIQNASMVLVGDALRSAQSLPGVASNNDLRSEFSVRGAAFDRIAVYVDGIRTDNFVHSFVGANTDDRVSLSLIDQDTVEALSILPGFFPAQYGDSTAAVTVVETREGNRVRPTGRFGTGIVATSGVLDGPFAHNRGSWLVSARTSYADYLQRLIQHITGTKDSGDSTIDFSDANIKIAYDFSPAHKVVLSTIGGLFTGKDNRTNIASDPDAIDRFKSRNSLINGHWRYTPGSNFVSSTRVFLVKSRYRNDKIGGLELDNRDRNPIRRSQRYSATDPGASAGVRFLWNKTGSQED